MISASVLQTLIYSDHFGFPLTKDEIHVRLISSKPYSLKQVSSALQLMVKKSQIEQSGPYYYLPGRKSLIAKRNKRGKLSSPQLIRAKYLASRLGKVPGVLAIYLTGSLAMQNSAGEADIDFMIITKNNRVWITRFSLTLYTELLGLRRRPNTSHNSGKLCLNLYLSPISYLLPPQKRSLYTAYELIQAIPLYDPSDTHSSLLAANSWITNFLPNFPFSSHPSKSPISSLQPGIIERLAYHLQLLYMRPKLTREYVTPDSAFFHPNDPGSKVLKKLRV